MPLDPSPHRRRAEELRELTGDENGAQRVAWTETWERGARVAAREARGDRRASRRSTQAGNQWFTLAGRARSARC